MLHADETTLQVLHEPGKSGQSKSYILLYRTDRNAAHPIVLYEYQPDWKADNPISFLKVSMGIYIRTAIRLMEKLENVVLVGCWAHARRKFNEAVKALPQYISPIPQKICFAGIGLMYCGMLFEIEDRITELPPDKRYTQRQSQAKPVLDAFLTWAKTRNAAHKLPWTKHFIIFWNNGRT